VKLLARMAKELLDIVETFEILQRKADPGKADRPVLAGLRKYS
jgi:hypothetical protein